MGTRVQHAVAHAAIAFQFLLASGRASVAQTDHPSTNIAAGAAFGSVTGTQPARTMQLNATFNF